MSESPSEKENRKEKLKKSLQSSDEIKTDAIPHMSITAAEESEKKVFEEIQKIADSIGKTSDNYSRPGSSQDVSEYIDSTNHSLEDIQKRVHRNKDKQETSKNIGSSATTAGSDFLDPSKISIEGFFQKRATKTKELQNSENGAFSSGLTDPHKTRGRDKLSTHPPLKSSFTLATGSSSYLDPKRMSIESIKKRFSGFDDKLGESDERSSTSSSLQLKRKGLSSGTTSSAASQNFYSGSQLDRSSNKAPSAGGLAKQIYMNRRFSSLSKHSDSSQKTDNTSTSPSRSGKFEKMDVGTVKQQAYAQFFNIVDARQKKVSGSGLGYKFMHPHSISKTADKYKTYPGMIKSLRGQLESPEESKDSGLLKHSSSSLSNPPETDILSSKSGLTSKKATSKKSSGGTGSDSTSIIFPGGQFNLLSRLADYLTEEKFINDEDHLIFIRTVKHMATVEIPEPILHGIKREVLPILKVRRNKLSNVTNTHFSFLQYRYRYIIDYCRFSECRIVISKKGLTFQIHCDKICIKRSRTYPCVISTNDTATIYGIRGNAVLHYYV